MTNSIPKNGLPGRKPSNVARLNKKDLEKSLQPPMLVQLLNKLTTGGDMGRDFLNELLTAIEKADRDEARTIVDDWAALHHGRASGPAQRIAMGLLQDESHSDPS
jgi:hypothetical protein